MADWNELPFELLSEIAMRLETIEDFVYFSNVCRTWNHSASIVKQKFRVKTMPWLLLAENMKENPDCLRKVLNPVNNRCYQLKLAESFRCRCWGSACGWLVTYNYDLELHLFNPLTKARMSLPPITRLPYQWGPHVSNSDYENHDEEGTEEWMRNSYITKAFVLEVAQDDFIVFVTYLFSNQKLAFARPSDQSWFFVDEPVRTKVNRTVVDPAAVDVVCHGARILVLFDDASLGFLDISDLSDPKKLMISDHVPEGLMILGEQKNLGLKVVEYVPAPQKILNGFDEYLKLYLIDSCGDTFMVIRDRRILGIEGDEDWFDYETYGFKVYRLDFDTKEWSQVHDVGDVALFVGNNFSMSIRGSVARNSKSNKIYFTDDAAGSWHLVSRLSGGKDMGAFDMESGRLEDIYDGNDKYSKFQPPLWFIPRF